MARSLALAVLAAALLTGCGSAPPLDLGAPPAERLGPALAVPPPLVRYRPSLPLEEVAAGDTLGPTRPVACAACEEPMAIPAEAYPPCPECGHEVFVARFSAPYQAGLDATGLQARVVELLAERGGFRGVRPAPELFGRPRDRRSADAAGAAWVLEVEVEDARVELVEQNGLFPVKIGLLIVQSVFIFPAVDPLDWVLPSEVYGLTARARWRLRDVTTGEVVDEGQVAPQVSDAFAAFNPFGPSRPWFLVGFLRVPNCLEVDDWAEISGALEERGREDLARALVLAVEDAARARAAR